MNASFFHIPTLGNDSKTRRTIRGFTLVELVVTVAIVGILASASYGSYTNYLIRANRSATQQFMLEIMNRQEMYLLDARTYTTDIGNTGLGLPAARIHDFGDTRW